MSTLATLVVVAGLVQQPAADSITLAQALDRARSLRPRAAVAAAVVDRARGAGRVGAMIPNPASQLESDDFSPTRKLTVSQPLGWLTRRGADLAAGHSGVERARADSAQQIADMGRDVRRAFFGAVAAARQLELVSQQAAYADSLAGIAERRAEAGDISNLERDQAHQEAARARLAAGQAREGARVSRTELARAIAWRGVESPRPAGALDDGLDAAASELTSSALDALPNIRAAVADSSSAAARLRAARIARVPVPGLVAGTEWGGVANNAGRNGRSLKLGFALPLPVWSQGNEAVAEASAALAERAGELAETRLTVAAHVEAARVRVAETRLRARYARDSLIPEARRIRAGAVRLYEAGRTNVVSVLDALRAERDVGRAALGEQLAFQEARAELAALLGRWP